MTQHERQRLLLEVRGQMTDHEFWKKKLDKIDAFAGVHLAIFSEPYLTFIANGTKTIESRFSKNRIAPFDQVDRGDVILVKGSGKGISGICWVEQTWFYKITPGTLTEIKDLYGEGICPAEESFWSDRSDRSYCSLIWISHYASLRSIPVKKRDRRGWVKL
jgi:hypothetical protein